MLLVKKSKSLFCYVKKRFPASPLLLYVMNFHIYAQFKLALRKLINHFYNWFNYQNLNKYVLFPVIFIHIVKMFNILYKFRKYITKYRHAERIVCPWRLQTKSYTLRTDVDLWHRTVFFVDVQQTYMYTNPFHDGTYKQRRDQFQWKNTAALFFLARN